MTRTLDRAKGRKSQASFFGIPHHILQSAEYAELSPRAVKLLMDLGSQYFGSNNGDLTVAWCVMNARGWKSKDSLNKARLELLENNFIMKTRQGEKRRTGLYAITFKNIDECIDKRTGKSKFDSGIFPTKTAPNSWKKY